MRRKQQITYHRRIQEDLSAWQSRYGTINRGADGADESWQSTMMRQMGLMSGGTAGRLQMQQRQMTKSSSASSQAAMAHKNAAASSAISVLKCVYYESLDYFVAGYDNSQICMLY
jgi:hypothetical protein